VNDEDFPINAGDEMIITTDEKYKTASNNKCMLVSQNSIPTDYSHTDDHSGTLTTRTSPR